MEFAQRCDIKVHAFFMSEFGHGHAQECLGRIGDAGAKHFNGLATSIAQMVLVIDEQRRAKLGGKFRNIDAADAHPPFGRYRCVVGKQVLRDRSDC